MPYRTVNERRRKAILFPLVEPEDCVLPPRSIVFPPTPPAPVEPCPPSPIICRDTVVVMQGAPKVVLQTLGTYRASQTASFTTQVV